MFDQQSSSLTLRPITVARYEANTVVVASGLAKGDIVVTAGVNTLTVGQKVRLADSKLRPGVTANEDLQPLPLGAGA